MISPFINTIQAGDYIRLSPRTLEKYRVQGGGPVFFKLGRRVLYKVEDLDRWAEERRQNSTSDRTQSFSPK